MVYHVRVYCLGNLEGIATVDCWMYFCWGDWWCVYFFGWCGWGRWFLSWWCRAGRGLRSYVLPGVRFGRILGVWGFFLVLWGGSCRDRVALFRFTFLLFCWGTCFFLPSAGFFRIRWVLLTVLFWAATPWPFSCVPRWRTSAASISSLPCARWISKSGTVSRGICWKGFRWRFGIICCRVSFWSWTIFWRFRFASSWKSYRWTCFCRE